MEILRLSQGPQHLLALFVLIPLPVGNSLLCVSGSSQIRGRRAARDEFTLAS